MRVVAELAPQRRHDLAEVVLLDHQTGPEREHQGVAVDQLARALDEQQQGGEEARTEAELAPVEVQDRCCARSRMKSPNA